jgi:hypothetical protein
MALDIFHAILSVVINRLIQFFHDLAPKGSRSREMCIHGDMPRVIFRTAAAWTGCSPETLVLTTVWATLMRG